MHIINQPKNQPVARYPGWDLGYRIAARIPKQQLKTQYSMKTKLNCWQNLKKSVAMTALALVATAGVAKAQSVAVDDSNVQTIISTSSVSDVLVGADTPGNVLGIYSTSSPGITFTSSGTVNVGTYSGSVGNVVSIANSSFISTNSFTIGGEIGADGNTINIISSTATFNGLFRVGFNGSDNAVNIYNSVVSFTGSGHFCIAGNSGAYNKAVISNTILKTSRFFVGGMAGATTYPNNNSAIVNGTSSVTITQDLNVGYNSGGSLKAIYGNTFSVFPGATVSVTASGTSAVRVNTTYSGNQIRIAKNGTTTASGSIVWTGDHVSDLTTLVNNGGFAYSDDNGASWATATSTSSFNISYSGSTTTITRP
jgi:hypothetical protein